MVPQHTENNISAVNPGGFQYVLDELTAAGIEYRLTLHGTPSNLSTIDVWYPSTPSSKARIVCDWMALDAETASCIATTIQEKLRQVSLETSRHPAQFATRDSMRLDITAPYMVRQPPDRERSIPLGPRSGLQ